MAHSLRRSRTHLGQPLTLSSPYQLGKFLAYASRLFSGYQLFLFIDIAGDDRDAHRCMSLIRPWDAKARGAIDAMMREM